MECESQNVYGNLALFGPAALKFAKVRMPWGWGLPDGGGDNVLEFRIDRCVSALWVRVNRKMSTILSEN